MGIFLGTAKTNRKLALELLIVITGFIAVACNNTGGSTGGSSGSSGGTTSTIPGTRNGSFSPGANTPPVGGQNFITITTVVRSNQDPNSLLELIGSNNEIGTQCPNTTDCSCVFDWTESNGILREAESPPVRSEANLLRCPFTVVTPDVKFFDVKIKILAANLGSNQVRVFMPVSNPSLDSSISTNYLPVYRYMCRDLLGKKQNTQKYENNSLVDPVLWDLSLPFTFYTTTFGRDYGAIPQPAAGGGAATPVPGFECPIVPNDPSDNPIYDYNIYSLDPIDPTNPTATGIPAGTGNNTIFPVDDDIGKSNCPTGAEPTCEKFLINRHDFYVSTFKSGTFKQPVCILHKVSNRKTGQLLCQVPQDTATGGPVTINHPDIFNSGSPGSDIIGFAAVPDQNQRCPDPNVVHIPTGKKWAKVWQFRTSYTQRTIQDVANSGGIADLFCATREKECVSNNNPPGQISICYNTKIPGGRANLGTIFVDHGPSNPNFGNCDENAQSGDGQGPLAAPAGGYGAPLVSGSSCKDTPASGNPFNCCRDDLGSLAAAPPPNYRPANYTPGGNWCNPGLIGSHDASSVGIGAHPAGGKNGVPGLGQDVWLMSNGSSGGCIEADTDQNGALALTTFPPAPNPYVMSPRPLDDTSQFDIVYVVTPERVNFEDMQDAENGPIARQYTPFRSKPNGAAGEQQKYTLFSGSQNTGTVADRLSQFPLCILQDSQKGTTVTTP